MDNDDIIINWVVCYIKARYEITIIVNIFIYYLVIYWYYGFFLPMDVFSYSIFIIGEYVKNIEFINTKMVGVII